MISPMDDPQLAEACRLQAEQTELGPALALLQKRGPLGATLVALAQSLGIPQSQLQQHVETTNVTHASALVRRLVEARVQSRQQGMEPAIYFAPPPAEPQRPTRPKPMAAPVDRASYMKPPAPAVLRIATPQPPAAKEADPRPPKPRVNLNVSMSLERDKDGQITVSNVRLSGLDAANYEIIAQAQDETSLADGSLRSLGIIVEIERR